MKKIKNIYGVYLSKDYFSFYIIHRSPKLDTVVKEEDGKELIIQTSKINKGKNSRLSVHCWYGEKGHATLVGNIIDSDDLVYDSGCGENGSVPWTKGRSYRYTYRFDENKMKVEPLLTKEEGFEILRTVPHRLGGWDPTIDNYDIQCACGEYMSNPMDGRVVEYVGNDPKLFEPRIEIGRKNHFLKEKPVFKYNDKLYKRIDWRDWHVKEFYNRNEYEEFRQYYKNDSNFEEEYPDFDIIWEKYYKDSSQEAVDKANMPAAGWRDPTRKVTYFSKSPIIGSYERVFSKGYMSEPAPGTVDCPCCNLLHRVYSETDCYIPWYGKIRRWIVFETWPIQKLYNDTKYRLQKRISKIKNRKVRKGNKA